MADKICECDEFAFPLTRGELGEMIGTTRETVSRALSGLSPDRIIEFSEGKFRILDKKTTAQDKRKGLNSVCP